MVEESNLTEIRRNINYLRFKRFKRAPDAKQEKCISCDVENFSNLLGMRGISDEVNKELSKSKTKLFGEMFLTLTEPPSFFERLYNKTIYGPQSRLIMLASNIVNKSPENFKLNAKKIYSKIASTISEKYHDEKSKNRDKQVLHPVHIMNTNGEFSRSSFIPFCSFGEELIGSKIDGFDMKVCNIFKPKLHYDQLCFETDLQELKDKDNFMNQLELGLTLVLDYNEERQINPLSSNNGSISKKEFRYNINNDNSVSMYLDTISIL